ncbi:MAG: hypothetical protein FJX00_01120 [Alphaproteobacteria bacterium]|nr:hypothetical protein [Alphaproteobacteria bacterium]
MDDEAMGDALIEAVKWGYKGIVQAILQDNRPVSKDQMEAALKKAKEKGYTEIEEMLKAEQSR